MLDPHDEACDRRLAHHWVALYYQSEEQVEGEYINMAVWRDYVAYACSYVNPRLSEEAIHRASYLIVEVNIISFVLLCTFFQEITATAHKRKEELAQALKKLIQSKGKTPALKYQQLFDDLRAQSDAAVTKEMFEEALHGLADDDFLTVTGKTVRLL
ncbi:DNA replication licensing factor mcm4-B-like [Malaclemys terrapin pileata]|uniref:DNA replication licensing factor mcm4-B-like n=1 Tax=Malaclemys terrapin pileata TaxID=2991368 RepID=UPI0023A82352|nr:DNA replication licensing factor mcm4-B-like [Malaclemys terrapin pileata]